MSTPVGFRYLFDSGYIDREMDIWFHVRVFQYDELSTLIASSLKGTQHSLRYRNRGLARGDNGAHPGGRRRRRTVSRSSIRCYSVPQ
jgi:hypothetical protein